MDSNITINIVEPGSVVPVPDTGLSTTGIDGAAASILVTIAVVVIIAIATILHFRKKKISLKPSKRTSTILGLLAIITSIGTFTGLTLNSIYNNTNAEEGTLTVNAEDADLTIELGDEPVFAVLPVDVKVTESTPAGYTLTASTDSTDLVSTTDSSKVIPMVAADEGELVALKDNTYGLSTAKPESKDDKTYTLLSTAADNPTFITDKDYKSTEANDTTTVYYGFYITPDAPYGTYKSSDIYYNATTNSSKVIFNGNGLYFNNNPEQTINDVEYITGITDKTAKYSYTPNIGDDGTKSSGVPFGTLLNDVVTIPNAASIKVQLVYGGGSYFGGYTMGYFSFWEGSHPEYRANINSGLGVQSCGDVSSVDGKYYSNYVGSGQVEMVTTKCNITGDTVTFDFWSQNGGPGDAVDSWYGYYAVITGYDADGNIIYLPGNIQVGGEYKDPAQDLPYIFKGWSEYKDATSPTYTSAEDIEKNAPLTMGETTELYAIWQHATKIHFDGNGSTSGEIPDKLLKPGEGANLCGYSYSRDGYIFNNWNTKPDGSGESYGQCYWYTAPTDQSVELNLYAQWTPVTTIVYDGNGGEGSGPTQTIRAGETSNIYGNWGYFNKDGYGFSHWNTKPDGSGETYYEGNQFTAPDQSTTITLYAQWQYESMIDFNGNGADSGYMPGIMATGGQQTTLPQNTFTKDGYSFNGWNTSADGTGESYPDQGTYIAPVSESQDITLYAQWLPIPTITITFNGNGADSGSMAPQTIVAGTPENLTPNAFTMEGYAFNSWNTSADGTGTSYPDQGTYIAPVSEPQNITLYAQWMVPPPENLTFTAGNHIDTLMVADGSNRYKPFYVTSTSADSSIVFTAPAEGTKYIITVVPEPGYVLSSDSTNSSYVEDFSTGTLASNTLLTTTYVAGAGGDNITISAAQAGSDSTHPAYTSMQDLTATQCPAYTDTAQGINVTDIRNNKSYAVAKFYDYCYMLSNIRVDGNTALTPATSHVSSDYTLPVDTGSGGWTNDYCQPRMASINGEYYYNWPAATARTNSTSGTSGCSNDESNFVGDICPAGWTLPTYYDITENTLWNSGANSGMLSTTGSFRSGSQVNVGDGGGWWSNRRFNNLYGTSAIGLYSYGGYPSRMQHEKKYGYSVRCMRSS